MVLTIGVTEYVYFNIRIVNIIFHPLFSICTIWITLLSKEMWERSWSKRKKQIRFFKWVRVLHKTTIKDFFKTINRDSHRKYISITQLLTLYKRKRWVEKTKCQKSFSFALKNITKVIQLKNAFYFSNMYATPSICIGRFVCDWQCCLDAVWGNV